MSMASNFSRHFSRDYYDIDGIYLYHTEGVMSEIGEEMDCPVEIKKKKKGKRPLPESTDLWGKKHAWLLHVFIRTLSHGVSPRRFSQRLKSFSTLRTAVHFCAARVHFSDIFLEGSHIFLPVKIIIIILIIVFGT